MIICDKDSALEFLRDNEIKLDDSTEWIPNEIKNGLSGSGRECGQSIML